MSDLLSGLGAVDAATAKNGFAPSPSSVLRPFRADERVLKSELPGVSNEAWTDFVFSMKVQPKDAVSDSNGVGMFDVRYKRLADLGIVANVRYKRDPSTNRSVQTAEWTKGSREEFLASAEGQYKTFVASMRAYAREMATGKIKVPPGMTASGALAILHRGGRAALQKWSQRQFESTKALFDRVNGVF